TAHSILFRMSYATLSSVGKAFLLHTTAHHCGVAIPLLTTTRERRPTVNCDLLQQRNFHPEETYLEVFEDLRLRMEFFFEREVLGVKRLLSLSVWRPRCEQSPEHRER